MSTTISALSGIGSSIVSGVAESRTLFRVPTAVPFMPRSFPRRAQKNPGGSNPFRGLAAALFSSHVQDAALAVALVHANHHAFGVEADAAAVGEAVARLDAAEHALVAARGLHRGAHFLLVGAAGAADRIGGEHHA